MKLRSVSAKGGKLNIYADDVFIMNVSPSIWYSSGYGDGDEIDDAEIDEFKEMVEGRLAYASAVRILTLRAHSKKELRDKLLRKFSPISCDYALERCAELGFIDDEDFAIRYASELYEKKRYGVDRIRKELQIKGVDRELIDGAINGLDIDSISCIIDIIKRKYSDCLSDEKGLRRIYSGCQRLGYSFSDVRKAIEQMNGENTDEY